MSRNLSKSVFKRCAWAALSLGLGLLLPLAGCDRDQALNSGPQGLQLRGVNLQPYTWTDQESYGSSAALAADQELAGLGANAIGIRQYVKVPHFDSDEVREDEVRGVNEDLIRREIRQQKAMGLHPMLTLGTALVDGRVPLEDGAVPTEAAEAAQISGDDCPPTGGWLAWHGTIDLDSPEAYDRYFAAYSDVLLKYARIAQDEGADVLSIGNELVSLTSTTKLTSIDGDYQYRLFRVTDPAQQAYVTATVRHLARFKSLSHPENGDDARAARLVSWLESTHARVRSGELRPDAVTLAEMPEQQYLIDAENVRRAYLERKWRALIAEVRQVFKRGLTYNANFDNFRQVGFWDALDAVGINAYFQLTPSDPGTGFPVARDMSQEELRQAWLASSASIAEFVHGLRHRRKVVFTELGFTNKRYSTSLPWAYQGCQSLVIPGQGVQRVNFGHRDYHPEERAAAFRALDQAIRAGELPWLAGVFLWDAYPERPHTGDDYEFLTQPSDPTRQAISGLFAAPPASHTR